MSFLCPVWKESKVSGGGQTTMEQVELMSPGPCCDCHKPVGGQIFVVFQFAPLQLLHFSIFRLDLLHVKQALMRVWNLFS